MSALSQALDAAIADQEVYFADVRIGGQSFRIASKTLTPADFSVANAAVSDEARKSKAQYVPFQQDPTNFAGQIALLVRKARLVVDGEVTDTKAFDAGDLPRLRRMGVGPISEMFADLFKDAITVSEDEDGEDVDAKGN